jgi:ArsR family transcriptional regulator
VDLIQIYQCFCDRTRLRILHLLSAGPLCVCHLQTLLEQSQVKISKHLAYLKEKGLVDAVRHQNWMIYRLPENRPPELEKNLQCLQECVQSDPVFETDLHRLHQIQSEIDWIGSAVSCCSIPPARKVQACH